MGREFWNGNRAAAEAAKLCRVQTVAAYPITPQTGVVEHISALIHNGELEAEMVHVESEHSAMSACAGAATMGARTFTASCSQGLMLMGEVLFMTSGCRLPVVMAVANRSLSAPVNIWGDQQDSLVLRDSGWIQLYSATVQEAYDNVLQAYRIAEDERVCLPVMVCYDGFYISHVSETVETLTQEQADEFLPSNETPGWTVLDVDNPFQLNQLLPPVAYSEYQYRKHSAMLRAREVATEVGEEFGEKFGRGYGLLDSYQCEDAEFIMVGMGSLTGTAKWVVNKLRGRGEKAGMVGVRMFRPFPEKEFAEATKGARALIVFDRAIGFGTCGMLYYDVTRVLYHLEKKPMALNFIVGLGGRDVTPEFIEHSYFRARMVVQDGLQDTTQTLFWPDADLEGLR